jgi:hypothetical protein
MDKRAQSMLEYTLLIMLVTAAFVSMNLYIRRAVNARLHNVDLELNPDIIVNQS